MFAAAPIRAAPVELLAPAYYEFLVQEIEQKQLFAKERLEIENSMYLFGELVVMREEEASFLSV